MNSIANAGAWAAIVLAALTTGMLASRLGDPDARVPKLVEGLLLAAAAAAVIAWCTNAGALLTSSSTSALLASYVPIEIPPPLRLGVLWATLPGATLTFATFLLVWAVLSGSGLRAACITSAFAAASMLLSVWFAPRVVSDEHPAVCRGARGGNSTALCIVVGCRPRHRHRRTRSCGAASGVGGGNGRTCQRTDGAEPTRRRPEGPDPARQRLLDWSCGCSRGLHFCTGVCRPWYFARARSPRDRAPQPGSVMPVPLCSRSRLRLTRWRRGRPSRFHRVNPSRSLTRCVVAGSS